MENGYANIAKFSSVASLPCAFANALALVETTQRYASKKKKKEEEEVPSRFDEFNLHTSSLFWNLPR